MAEENLTKAQLVVRVAELERMIGKAVMVIESLRAKIEAQGAPAPIVPTHKLVTQFDATCRECGDEIEKGEWIAWAYRGKTWCPDCVSDAGWEKLAVRKLQAR